MVVESAVGVVSVSAVVRSAAAVSAAAVAIAASVVIANGAAHRAAAASGAVIASGVAAAGAIAQCVLVATNSSTYATALATWTDLWACTATCAICHARTWTAIRWTGTAIARADGRACLNTSGRVNSKPDSIKLAALAALEPIWTRQKTRTASTGPRTGRKCAGAIQMDIISVK